MQKSFVAARKHYEEALENHPKDFEAMNFYAQFLCQQTYDFKIHDTKLFLVNKPFPPSLCY